MQVHEVGIKRLVLLSSTIVIVTITIAVSLFLITTENKNFQTEVQRIEEELITTKKRNIENRLQNLIDEVKFDQLLMRNLQLDELKNFINTLFLSLQNHQNDSSQSTMKEILSTYDLDDTIHGFAFFDDGTILWNPRNPQTQGKNYINTQDINDKFYIQNMIEVAKSGQEDNAISFSWYIPGETTISTNIAFVKYLPHLKLIVGAYRSEESINNWIQTTILQKISSHQLWKDSLFL